MEDSSIVYDLRVLNSNQASKHDVFWEQCQKLLAKIFLLQLMTDAMDIFYSYIKSNFYQRFG
jgi:hypothetical protein